VILLLNGPNLGLLGTRQPEIYGTATLADHEAAARAAAWSAGHQLSAHQSDSESALVARVHEARDVASAIIINAGAFTHYAWALADALAAFDGPVVEVHLSNPDAREPWRHTSVITPVADGIVAGFGGFSYVLAVQAAIQLLEAR
jgi:3-dehydroquinate dehydratase-2